MPSMGKWRRAVDWASMRLEIAGVEAEANSTLCPSAQPGMLWLMRGLRLSSTTAMRTHGVRVPHLTGHLR